MSFLLDGLHEDLNRVKQKPYIPTPDSAGRPDAVVAKEQWGNYRARDDSIIVDLYTGLLKSSLRFDRCGRVSTTFDAYTSLSLPLPKEKIKHLEVTLVWLEKTEDDAGSSSVAAASGSRSRRVRARPPTKFCIEFDSSVAFAAAATAAAAANASKTVTAGASSTTAASASASSASPAASLSAAAAAAASATATAAALAISRPALAASTRVADVKIALSRLSGVSVSRLQLARLQLSIYDIWKRRQFHFLQNYQSISDYALSMQAAAGPTGNKNDVFYAFEMPETTSTTTTTKTTQQPAAAAAPVTHVPTVGYIAADVSASNSSYQSSLSSRPFVHDGMVASHAPSASHPPHATAAFSLPATATPTPALAPASVSSTPSLPDNPVSHSSPYPTTFGGLGGMVQLGMKFDVKDSVAKWEVATVRDIRMLVSMQTMMEMGGKLETNHTATAQQSAPPVAARSAAAHPPSALVPTHSLRKRSSATDTDAVRFSDDTSDVDEDDTTAKARIVPPNPAQAASATAAVAPASAATVAATATAAPAAAVGSQKEEEDGECIHFDDPDDADEPAEDEVAPLAADSVASAAAAQTETNAATATTITAAAATPPTEQSASTKHVRDASLTATSTTLQTPTAVASQSQPSSSASTLPRFSASNVPGFVYQHLPEVARKLPPDFPPVELHFGFDGFSVKWNEWVPIQSSRIAPYGSGLTKTHGRGSGGAGTSTGGNLNAAYLTGPPPAHGFGYNPLYTGSALSTLGGGSSLAAAYGYGYSSFDADADVECGVIRVQVLQRCAKPVPPVTIKATVLPMPTSAVTAGSSNHTLAVPVAHLVGSSPSTSSSSSPAAPAPSGTPAPDAVTGLTPSSVPAVPYDMHYFSVPLILWLDPRTTTTAQLYDLVWNKVKRYTSLPDVLTNPTAASTQDQSRSASLDRAASAQVDALEQIAAAHENGIVGNDSAISSEQVKLEMSTLPEVVRPQEAAPSSAALGEPTVTAISCASLPPYFFAASTSPFTLRYSNSSGTQCSRCQTYSKACIGCPLHLTVPNEEQDRADAIAAAAVIVDGDMQPVVSKPLLRDTLLISPGDRAAHVRSWHNDCTLLLDWNTDYMEAGLIDVNEQARLEIDPSVTSFRALAAREDHASKVDLNVCMSLFTQTEKLAGDAAVYCSACKTHEEATKTLELYSTPPLLVLHLKRLLPDTKLFTDVRFPLKGFDPKPFLASSRPTPAHASASPANAEVVVVEDSEEKQAADAETVAKEKPASSTESVGVVPEALLPAEPANAAVSTAAPSVVKSDEALVADVQALVKVVNSTEAVAVADSPQSTEAQDAQATPAADMAFRVEVTQAAGVTAEAPPSTAGATETAVAPTAAVTAAPESDAGAISSAAIDQPAPDTVVVSPVAVTPPATPSPSAAAAVSSSPPPSPLPSSPPAVFTPVGGGFDASVAGGAAGSNGKSKSSADLYDLYAAVHHFGAVGGGHYIAYALDRDRGLWFKFDDSKLTQIAQEKVVSNSAYMLFYERRGMSQNAGVDAVPPVIRNKTLDAKGRRWLKESEGGVNGCQACVMQ